MRCSLHSSLQLSRPRFSKHFLFLPCVLSSYRYAAIERSVAPPAFDVETPSSGKTCGRITSNAEVMPTRLAKSYCLPILFRGGQVWALAWGIINSRRGYRIELYHFFNQSPQLLLKMWRWYVSTPTPSEPPPPCIAWVCECKIWLDECQKGVVINDCYLPPSAYDQFTLFSIGEWVGGWGLCIWKGIFASDLIRMGMSVLIEWVEWLCKFSVFC